MLRPGRGVAPAFALALAAVSCIGPSAPSSSPTASPSLAGGVTSLLLLEAEDAQTLDPALVDDPTSLAIASEVFEGLTRLDANLRPVPALAKGWDITDSGRTYTFHLRNARYQTGAQVQAQDAVTDWNRALDPQTASPLTTFFSPLGARYPGDLLNGVEAIDRATLRLRLARPNSELLTLLSMPPYWLYDPKNAGSPTSGSGPYRLERWEHGQSLQLGANDSYWGAAPQVRTVKIDIEPDAATRLDRFQHGGVDIAHGFTGPQLLAFERDPQQAAELHKVPVPQTTWLAFNTLAGSRYSPQARLAVAQAIDRGRLTDLTQFGSLLAVPATDLIPPGLPGHLDRSLPYDPAAARRALDQAGFAGQIDLYISASTAVGRVARELHDQLSEATGRTVVLHPLGDFFTQASLDRLPFFIDTWRADVPYPADLLENVLRTNGQFNNLRLQDGQVDAALNEGRDAPSFEAALTAYQRAEEIVLKDARLIPLYSGVEPYLVHTGVRVAFTGGLVPYRWEEVR